MHCVAVAEGCHYPTRDSEVGKPEEDRVAGDSDAGYDLTRLRAEYIAGGPDISRPYKDLKCISRLRVGWRNDDLRHPIKLLRQAAKTRK